MVRYHGVLSSHAKLRPEVVPKVHDKAPKQLALFEHDRTVLAPEPRKKPWAWLLRHVLQIDVVTCVRCGGTTRLLEAATTPEAIAKLLAKHGLWSEAPAPAPRSARSAPPRVLDRVATDLQAARTDAVREPVHPEVRLVRSEPASTPVRRPATSHRARPGGGSAPNGPQVSVWPSPGSVWPSGQITVQIPYALVSERRDAHDLSIAQRRSPGITVAHTVPSV
jgi:hypothetical protein